MRDDLHKVIVERPRWGHSLPSRKMRWSTTSYDPDRDDDQPARASMASAWNSPRKEFSDRLGPLRRFISKQVGRPWRKVEAEFRAALDLNTLMGRHLWDHVRCEVETDCWIDSRGWPHRRIGGAQVLGLFVHPRSGLLLRPKPDRRDPAAALRRRIETATQVRLDEGTRAEKIDGRWHLFITTGRLHKTVIVTGDGQGRRWVERVVRPQVLRKHASREEIERIRGAIEADYDGAPRPK